MEKDAGAQSQVIIMKRTDRPLAYLVEQRLMPSTRLGDETKEEQLVVKLMNVREDLRNPDGLKRS